MYLIYKHTSKTTGKSYIGKTSNISNPNKRWKNGLGYPQTTQPAFYNAIQKYGWEDFEHTILENYIQTVEEACEREKYWINYYHTWIYDSECNGYNITQGGDGAAGHKLSDETKQKLRKARLEQKNVSLTHNKGKIYYNNGIICKMYFEGTQPVGFVKGRLMSAGAKQKISQAMSRNNSNRKGQLNKVVIIKDGQLKCIGEKNLNKYLTVGWEIYKKGNGGKIQHGR